MIYFRPVSFVMWKFEGLYIDYSLNFIQSISTASCITTVLCTKKKFNVFCVAQFSWLWFLKVLIGRYRTPTENWKLNLGEGWKQETKTLFFSLHHLFTWLLEKKERVNALMNSKQRFLNKFSNTFCFQRTFAFRYVFQVEYFEQLQFYAFTVVENFKDSKNRFQNLRVLISF